LTLFYAVLLGPAPLDFENVSTGDAHGTLRKAKRDSRVYDSHDLLVTVDEDHVEGDQGVLHPKRVILVAIKDENHA
jgi:hypothetical protein